MFRLFLVLFLGLVSNGFADDFVARAHPRPPKRWHLHPVNIPSQTLSTAKQVIRDHRFMPLLTYTIFTANIRGTEEAGSEGRLEIRYSDGSQYDGRDAYGTIRNVGINRCLTNPATYVGGPDNGLLRWESCKPNTAGLAYRRQLFLIEKNQNGFVRVQSDLQYVVQLPNAKSECLRQVTPTEVRREICNGLHSWMIKR